MEVARRRIRFVCKLDTKQRETCNQGSVDVGLVGQSNKQRTRQISDQYLRSTVS